WSSDVCSSDLDAANDAPRIIKELEGLRVSHILTTHGHADHLQALKPVREQTHAQFTCHVADESMMPIKADHRVEDGERFRFGDYEVVALHTPGHTPGSICFVAAERL